MSDALLARLGLVSGGMLLLYRCSDVWNRLPPRFEHPVFTVSLVWFCLLGALALLGAAFLSRQPVRWSPLLLAGLLLSQWSVHAAFVATEAQRTAPSDTVVLSLQAAVLDWLGDNPYGYAMHDVLSAYESTGASSTPHLDGAQVETLPYPPLHFLVLRPILPWGLEGARLLYSLSFSLLALTVYLYAPARFRPVVLLPLFINPELMHFPFYWASDSLWAWLLALSLCLWHRPWARAILLGLACAYKQTPWVFAPFMAVRVARESDRPVRAVATFTGLSFAVFAVLNAPYAWRDPGAWWQGVFDPMLSPYVSLGRGFSMLMQTDLAPFSKSYFSALTLLVFIGSIVFYYHGYHRLRPLLWLFPALTLFFSYRSLPHYFIYSVPLLTMELSRWEEPEEPPAWPRTWYLPLLAVGLGMLALTVRFWPGPANVEARLLTWQPNRAEVDLTNRSAEPMKPNFYIRNDWRTFPWTISRGPLVLRPGETARYTVGTDLHYRTLQPGWGGQIVVGDGRGEQGYRAVLDVPRRPSLLYPRALENPTGPRWGRQGDVWQEGETIHMAVHPKAPKAIVTTETVLPYGELHFEVLRPERWDPKTSLGLEVRDQSGRRLSVWLGDQASQGRYDAKHFFRVVPSHPGWNRIELNLRSLYTDAGFPLPNLDRVLVHDVELIDRPITLSLVLYSKSKVDGVAFRGLELARTTTPGHRIADLRHHRREFSAVQADAAARRRHYDQALALYRQAEPLQSPVRTTQEGSYLVLLGSQTLQGAFPLAGWGWGALSKDDGILARPFTEVLATIPILAAPGTRIRLQLLPETSYAIRWNDGPWQDIPAKGWFEVPAPSQIFTLAVRPSALASLARIQVQEP